MHLGQHCQHSQPSAVASEGPTFAIADVTTGQLLSSNLLNAVGSWNIWLSVQAQNPGVSRQRGSGVRINVLQGNSSALITIAKGLLALSCRTSFQLLQAHHGKGC